MRGPNKQPPWQRRADDGLSLLRLPLDTSDPLQRSRVEAMFSAAHALRRALQRDVRARCKAYWAAIHERAASASAVRDRLGLSRSALEHTAYAHLDGAPHLRRYVTKALAMHVADGVWTAADRHLFRDASGKTAGMPRIGRWFDFTQPAGRARSHTKANKWETFRLHGSLAGHRAAYTNERGFYQPRTMQPIAEPAAWWSYDGPLAVVFTGLAAGTLVLPVRLPSSPCNQPFIEHHLGDPSCWHKITLVRYRDPQAAGGWRYEAHLLVLVALYVSESTQRRREATVRTTSDRTAGIDVNVSNVNVASHARGRDLTITRIERTAHAKAKAQKQAKRERRRQRALDRSRRAANRAQYQLSKRQEKRARRRAERGLSPIDVVPAGLRITRGDGKPMQSYAKDQLSAGYRRGRAAQAADHASQAQARRARAREIAGQLVREHGYQLVVEDTSIATWARSWGRALSAFSPGLLVTAVSGEASAVAGLAGVTDAGVARASTRTTALSQRCLCGARVAKTLAQRTHACGACGLRADRDAMAATLAACVVVRERATPASAYVDEELARALLSDVRTCGVLADTLCDLGRQDVPTESTAHSARDGHCIAEKGRTPDYVRWLGESLARPYVQPRMSLALRAGPRRSVRGGEPTWPEMRVDSSTALRDSS
jgi:hypothetical protein